VEGLVTQPQTLPTEPPSEMEELELAAVLAVTGGLSAALAGVLAAALAAYEAVAAGGAASGLAAASIAQAISKRLRELTWPDMDGPLRTYGGRAQAVGAGRALDSLPAGVAARVRRSGGLSGRLEQVPLDRMVRERLDEAAKLATTLPMDTKRNVMAVVGRASSAKALAEGTTRQVVYGGASRGVLAVARQSGRNLIWVPERNACLHCLAHAGWVVTPGGYFPKGLTYADRPLDWRVQYPPLHPNCRCEIHLTLLEPGAPSRDRARVDPAARLAAEARRSVVLGWTDNASEAATLRAMDRLLRQGADLPTSVEQRARAAVRAGKLPRRPR
jgi:hypothetical protein